MKAAVGIFIIGATVAQAQINTAVNVTVPAENVDAVRAILDTYPPVYEFRITQVTNTYVTAEGTNVVVTPVQVRVEITETPKQKFRRISSKVLSDYWSQRVAQSERLAIKERTIVETP